VLFQAVPERGSSERRGPVFTVSWAEFISEGERCQEMNAVPCKEQRKYKKASQKSFEAM